MQKKLDRIIYKRTEEKKDLLIYQQPRSVMIHEDEGKKDGKIKKLKEQNKTLNERLNECKNCTWWDSSKTCQCWLYCYQTKWKQSITWPN